MNVICYLLDENVDPIYRAELLKREPSLTVWRIGSPGAPPRGTPDPEILCWCEEHEFILVTNNRKSITNGQPLRVTGWDPAHPFIRCQSYLVILL